MTHLKHGFLFVPVELRLGPRWQDLLQYFHGSRWQRIRERDLESGTTMGNHTDVFSHHRQLSWCNATAAVVYVRRATATQIKHPYDCETFNTLRAAGATNKGSGGGKKRSAGSN